VGVDADDAGEPGPDRHLRELVGKRAAAERLALDRLRRDRDQVERPGALEPVFPDVNRGLHKRDDDLRQEAGRIRLARLEQLLAQRPELLLEGAVSGLVLRGAEHLRGRVGDQAIDLLEEILALKPAATAER
jgi:hypothetical protein